MSQLFSDFLWSLQSPSLLDARWAAGVGLGLVGDLDCARWVQESRLNLESIKDRLVQPAKSGRLGDVFEGWIEIWLKEVLGFTEVRRGIQIPGPAGTTRGELDLVFNRGQKLEHWEVAVKFYMCISPDTSGATELKNFVGQALKDRLDLKLEHLMTRQIPLGTAVLGQQVDSRVLMKGRLFYPLEWQNEAIPVAREISPTHERGWWLAWDFAEGIENVSALRSAHACGWVILPKSRWLSSCVTAQEPEVLDTAGLRMHLDQHFKQSDNALQVAQVARVASGEYRELPWNPSGFDGPRRLMVLKPNWPALGQ